MKPKINKINTKKNLLAFSAGVDSTALFFLLLENDIPFDIAIVDYNVREQSKEEINYAKELALKYNKQIFTKEVSLENNSNFEKTARDIRYSFFEELIKQHSYETLITAHQLNDKLEWFLMQLSKGAGLVELLSFEELNLKENYQVFKPLVNISKKELLEYLKANNIKYFVDNTNFEKKYKRNYFREKFANSFIDEFKNGVIKSFEYLQNDKNSLSFDDLVLKEKKLEIFKASNDDNLNIRTIDISLKKRGILLSKLQRDEILKQKEIVVSHKISVSITKKYIYISPYENIVMNKEFKEKCRLKKIPKNVRSYIFKENLLEHLVI